MHQCVRSSLPLGSQLYRRWQLRCFLLLPGGYSRACVLYPRFVHCKYPVINTDLVQINWIQAANLGGTHWFRIFTSAYGLTVSIILIIPLRYMFNIASLLTVTQTCSMFSNQTAFEKHKTPLVVPSNPKPKPQHTQMV